MKLSSIISICSLFLTLSLSAQNWESVKHSGAYIWGEGYGASVEEADKKALADLISKIVVSVTANTKSSEKAVVTNGQLNEEVDFRSYSQTYSQATLTNTERLIIHNEPDAHVGRWIKRTEVEKIFDSRKQKVSELIRSALRAEEKGKADDALRNWYWALKLTESLQYPNQATFTEDDGTKHMVMTWVPERMNEIFDDLRTEVTKRNGEQVDLKITYKGKPVNSVDYTYFDGQTWSNIYSARDGIGTLELAPGNTSDSYQIKYEYTYTGQAQIDPEIESVLSVARTTPMRRAYADVKNGAATVSSSSNVSNETVTLNQITQPQKSTESFTSTDESIMAPPTLLQANNQAYHSTMQKVATAISRHSTQGIQHLFTDEGWDIYNRLIHYGNARIVGSPDYILYENGEYVTCHGIKMSFSFRTGVRKAFVEEVVFTFDKQQKICNIAFGLGQTAEDDILYKGSWNENTRKAIMNFLENYKTAYALKRLDYIEQVFDDDAVIIIGSVIRKSTMYRYGDGKATFKNSEIVRHNRYSKDQYLEKMKRCFQNNEYVNIRFANNDVRKLGKGGELYAIQIAQDYYSSRYGDKGYLFLMVDINDPENPTIKVRTWQKEPDPEFGLYGPEHFR